MLSDFCLVLDLGVWSCFRGCIWNNPDCMIPDGFGAFGEAVCCC